MYWFRFGIPVNSDGSRIIYSKGWHGTMPKCPKDVVVLLYNDKEGYGIAKTEDTFVPPEVTVLTEGEANKVLVEVKDEEGVYFGQKLEDRYLPEAETKKIDGLLEGISPEALPVSKIVADTFCKSCPSCHKVVAYIVQYEDGSIKIVQNGKTLIDGIKAKSINLVCPSGHRVKVVLDGR